MDFELIAVISLITVGICYAIVKTIKNDIWGQKRKINEQESALRKKESALHKKEVSLAQQEERIKKLRIDLDRIVNDKSQQFPYLSELLAEWNHIRDIETSNKLLHKSRPALRASEEIRAISKEKRILEKERNAYKHQLTVYESLFPWLEEFKELPPQEALQIVTDADEPDEYSRVKNWLSPEEYAKLSSAEKWQLALDRYANRSSKTDWHIGIEYERYIGYLYESKGCKVHYEGALKGLDDRGRDLVVERGSEILVIQCKRWAKHKVIHEKHVMQLFGSVAILNMESEKKHKGILVTTTELSDTARYFAKLLDIEAVENYEYKDYPLIKCNISKTGEKIYHLPFDLQYDKIHIDISKGNFYAKTVAEAENNGFRHAFKWHGIQGE